ncbi:MAG: teichoic acid transport system permease protein [Candidatus Aldehydirespiratoraceae bacterium]|jgi:teichoic acid transport system permease protein
MTMDKTPSINDTPDVLGVSETEELTRQLRRELRATRRQQKKGRRVASSLTDDADITFVYEPHVRYVPPIRPYLRELWTRRAFAIELAKSDVKGARSNTLLGGLWTIIDPLFMVCLYYFLFTVIREGSRPSSFVPVIIFGILHFQVSAAALTAGGNSVASASSLMLNSTFPRLLLPLASILGGVIKFAPSIPIIFGALLFLDATVSLKLLWWPVLFAVQIAIGIGLALIISTGVVFFKDVKNVLTYVSRLMFFTSPVIYPASFLSDSIISYVKWSPLFGVFFNFQEMVNGRHPDTEMLLISLGWMSVSLLLGGWLFLRYEREFATKL